MKTAYLKKHLINFLFAAAFMPGAAIDTMAAQVYHNTDEILEESVSDHTQEEIRTEKAPDIAIALSDHLNTVLGAAASSPAAQADTAASLLGAGAVVPGQFLNLPKIRSLGVFKTTGYCPCRSCSAGWGYRTSTGAIASANHTIAVDPNVIPYGTKVMINGIIYTAEDCGGSVRGNHIDIFFNTHSESRNQGIQYAEVFILE